MKKLFPTLSIVSRFVARWSLGPPYIFVALISLTGCMATQNRWQATQMRHQIMDYYNDQIMENLIRAQSGLPYVHVDVTLLTTTDGAGLTGSVGNGETISSSRTSPSMMGALHTIARGVTRPFSYSVSPSRTTSLQIQASPVLGRLSGDSLDPFKNGSTSLTIESDPADASEETDAAEQKSANSDNLELSKRTEVEGPNKEKKTIREFTAPKSKSSKAVTIYDVYDTFRHNYSNALKCSKLFPPASGYVPGTIKQWGTQYYYISDDQKSKEGYFKLCKSLFTKTQSQSVEKAIEAKANAAAAAAEIR